MIDPVRKMAEEFMKDMEATMKPKKEAKPKKSLEERIRELYPEPDVPDSAGCDLFREEERFERIEAEFERYEYEQDMWGY